MASKRLIKKSINNLTFELISECYTYEHFHQGKNSQKVSDIIEGLIDTRNTLVSKINNAPSGNSKETAKHFKEIRKELALMVNQLDKIESKA